MENNAKPYSQKNHAFIPKHKIKIIFEPLIHHRVKNPDQNSRE
jgi:hypothetical protein